MSDKYSYEQYLAETKVNTSAIGRYIDKITNNDQRLDALVKLQFEQTRLLQEYLSNSAKQQYVASGQPYYNTRNFKLDIARADEEIQLPGNTVIAYTDGILDNCLIKLDSSTNDPIYLNEFNPYYHALGFTKIYLTTDAQSGKYLRLLITRGSPPGNTVGDMNVHIQSNQKVGLFLQPEFAANTGTYKNFTNIAGGVVPGGTVGTTYVVPLSKTLYITQIGAALYTTGADAELNQICLCQVYDSLANQYWAQGGNGGVSVIFNTPLVISGGTTVTFSTTNFSNHNCSVFNAASGYEL